MEGVFPEPKPLSGKRLVPQLAVGCFVFALIGLLGTFVVGNALQPFFKHRREDLARQAEAREAKSRAEKAAER